MQYLNYFNVMFCATLKAIYLYCNIFQQRILQYGL